MKTPQLLLLLALVLLPRAAAGQEPPEPPVAAAEEEKAGEPLAASPEPAVFDLEACLAQLEECRLEAEARSRAADRLRAGEMSIEEAFPELARAPLDSAAWIHGRLAELDDRGTAYAAETLPGRAPDDPSPEEEATEIGEEETPGGEPPDGQPPEDEDPLSAARDATLQALRAADDKERHFLHAVLAYLEQYPQLTRPELASTRIDLAAWVDAAEDAFTRAVKSADESAAEQRARGALAAQRQVDRLEKLLRSLMLHVTIDAPPPDPAPDVAQLEEPAGAEAAALRLRLLRPFLDDDERTVVDQALDRWREVAEQDAAEQVAAESLRQSAAARRAEMQTAAGLAEQKAQKAEIERDRRLRETENRRKELQDSLKKHRETDQELAEQPPGDGGRLAADTLYGKLRELERDVLQAIGDAGSKSIEADRALALAQSEAAEDRAEILLLEQDVAAGKTAPAADLFANWEQALEDRVNRAEDLAELERLHRDQVSVVLRDARALRRGLRSKVSFKTMWQDLFDDLKTEAKLIGPNMVDLADHRRISVLELPSRLQDLGFAGSLLLHVFWILLVAAVNLVARRQAPGAIRRLLQWWTRDRRYVPRDLRNMARPAERTLKALVDLAAGAVLLWLLGDALPELGLLYQIYLLGALYRFLVGLAALAVAHHPEVRPALLTLEPRSRETVLTSVRIVALWLIARQFSRFFATRILAAVTLDEVLRIGFNLMLAALAAWLLHVWEPVVRDALQRRAPTHRLVIFLARRRLPPFAALLTPALALAYLWLWTRDLLSRHVLDSAPAGGDDDKGARLPGEFMAQLLRRECPENGYVERPATGKGLDQALRQWQQEKRRGVVMLIGSQGAGKRTLVDHWCQAMETAQRPVTRIRLTQRLTTSDEACRWLAEALSIEDPPAEPEALAGRINSQLAGQIVVVRDLHFAFLRRVDGFAALRCLLAVVGSASRQIFWLLSMHRPGWHYLESLGGWINTEACRRVIELEPFREVELRRLVEQRIAAAGHEVGFSWLLPRSARHDVDTDPLAVERITAEYFRRLAWVSEGNPAVALRLWRETLVPGKGDGHLEVARFGQPAPLPALRDLDLFLLAAIFTHRSLTEDELVEVTNMSPAQVSAAARNLEARRLLAGRSKRLTIEPRYLPAVIAELRRRHFVHGGA